jgi:TP901 family phage tail tape measure protein
VSVVANVAINVDSRNAVTQLRQVETRAKATERAFGALQQAVAAFGAGFALTKVIADVKELDTNLRRLATVGGDVQALDKGLGALSKQLDGVASKAELAAASYQALSAGFTETGANLKVVEAATKAAVGGLVDVTSVVEVTTKTLNAYGLSGEYAIKVTDSISKAIEFGQVQWSDYTSQLGRVASIAATAGVSLDEVNAFIAAATKNGATAEVAFTGLGATLATILKPSKESAEAAAALGINWTLAGIRGEGFESLMTKLAKAMQENPVLATEMVGGQEAIRGAFAAASKGGKDYQMILEGLGGATGKTEMDFQTMKGSLENTLKGLDTAFKNLSEALGKAFGPTIALTIQDTTKAINGIADAMNLIPQPVLNAAGSLAKAIVQLVLLRKAIEAIIGLRALFFATMTGMATTVTATGTAAKGSASAFALYTANTKTLEASTISATGKVRALQGALAAIAAIGVITVTVQILTQGQEAVAAAIETARLRKERGAGGAAAIYGGSATKEQKQTAQQTLAAVRKEQATYRAPGTVAAQTLLGPLAPLFGVPTTAQAGARRTVLAERALRAQATMGLPTRAEAGGGGGGGGGNLLGGGEGGGGKPEKDKAAEEEKRLQARIRGLQIETEAAKQLSLIRGKITQAEIAGDKQLAIRLQGEERNQQILIEYQKSLEGVTDEREQQALLAKALADLDAAGIETAGELEKLANDRKRAVEDVVSSLEMELLKLQATTDVQKQAIQFLEIENQLKSQGIILSDADKEAIRRKIAEIQKLTKEQEAANAKLQMEKDLFDGIANTVASSFSSAIDAAVSGTENLGDALKKLGSDLLATIGKMLIMYAIGQALGALGGGDGKGVFSFLAAGFGFKGAKDGAYWPGGFEAFANGGVVTSPTMGLIGEGGEPEYVIPQSKMSAAMSRYSRGARGESVIPGSGTSTESAGGTAVATAPIDVRYTVERINSVDYVTADQFQAGMRQAAAQGAKQGEQRALSTLRQNTNVRRSVGI